MSTGHRGNKSYLPSTPCAACGRPMSWRQPGARTWAPVQYCSDACRKRRADAPAGGRP